MDSDAAASIEKWHCVTCLEQQVGAELGAENEAGHQGGAAVDMMPKVVEEEGGGAEAVCELDSGAAADTSGAGTGSSRAARRAEPRWRRMGGRKFVRLLSQAAGAAARVLPLASAAAAAAAAPCPTVGASRDVLGSAVDVKFKDVSVELSGVHNGTPSVDEVAAAVDYRSKVLEGASQEKSFVHGDLPSLNATQLAAAKLIFKPSFVADRPELLCGVAYAIHLAIIKAANTMAFLETHKPAELEAPLKGLPF